ncbi:MAG: site-specific DNA-methyltransferase [Ilumatobacteraceae bacterium]|nr:site-specific DNA-methyltransferase [Ilumatobacteraceae bacterium]
MTRRSPFRAAGQGQVYRISIDRNRPAPLHTAAAREWCRYRSRVAPDPSRAEVHATGASRGLPAVRQGDAFQLIGQTARDSVDLIVTSPPYWGLRTYGLAHRPELLDEWREESHDPAAAPPWSWYKEHGGVLGLEPYPEWYVAHLVEFFSRAMQTLKPTGSLWLNIGDTYFARWSSMRADGRQGLSDSDERTRRRTPAGGWRHDKQLMLMPSRVAIGLQDAGWILRNDLIWRKTNAMPRPETDRLRTTHEHLFHFVRRRKEGRPSYWYDLSAAEDKGVDVVDYACGRSRNDHSATFPADLIEARIRSSSPPGGLVLDPFCGTGRALEVAVANGRRAQGFELSENYAKAARANVRRAKLTAAKIHQVIVGDHVHQVGRTKSAMPAKQSAAVKATDRSSAV